MKALKRETVLIFYPHNPFRPLHGSHLRCLQQLEDLSNSFEVILASSSKLSDTTWPRSSDDLIQVAQDNDVRDIVIFERSIIGLLNECSQRILKAISAVLPTFPSVRFGSRIHQELLLAWFNSLALRYQPCASIVHYTYWAYLSRVSASGVKVLELHDLLPVNHYLTERVSKLLQGGSLLANGRVEEPVEYVNSLSQLPKQVVTQIDSVVDQANKFDLVWMISRREEQLLSDLGMNTKSEVIYPHIKHKYVQAARDLPAILPIGPNAFNTYCLLKFINDVIPLLDPCVTHKSEIQITGRFWCDRPTPMPHPLKYYGVVDKYGERLSRSAFMIAPTSVGTGQQIKIFEALACGIPVIAYRSAVPDDVLIEYSSIISVNNPSEFAAVISQLWRDRQLMQHYWGIASEVAERQAKRGSTFPYCRSLQRAVRTNNVKTATSLNIRVS